MQMMLMNKKAKWLILKAIKRIGVFTALICSFFIVTFTWFPEHAYASSLTEEVQARSFIIMEMKSGLIIEEKESTTPNVPASLTKVMTAYLVLDEVHQGGLKWEDKVTIGSRAAGIGETQVYLRKGEEFTVKELFQAMLVYSANDASVALAEHIAGSEEAFVHRMNHKAKSLGLQNTHFVNCTGLPRRSYMDPPLVAGKQLMTAEDMANLTRQLLRNYPEVFETVSQPHIYFREGKPNQKLLRNWNMMLPSLIHAYSGVDGVKTGFTSEAGYNFAGTAKQNGMRLITVVMGTQSNDKRFIETRKLMDYGFQQYEMKQMIHTRKGIPGHPKISVDGGVEEEVKVVAKNSLHLPVRKEKQKKYGYQVEITKKAEAPLSQGSVVGKVDILYDGKKIPGLKSVPLVIENDVEEASWFRKFFRGIRDFFTE